jgi:hypothetical protein
VRRTSLCASVEALATLLVHSLAYSMSQVQVMDKINISFVLRCVPCPLLQRISHSRGVTLTTILKH